ncbi:hypothetical protein J6590_035554, partial [Homalodisca vitripennis]
LLHSYKCTEHPRPRLQRDYKNSPVSAIRFSPPSPSSITDHLVPGQSCECGLPSDAIFVSTLTHPPSPSPSSSLVTGPLSPSPASPNPGPRPLIPS